MSPSDLGEALKPFVFLDLFVIGGARTEGFSIHPHSGIATLTYTLSGDSIYEDTTGKQGILRSGGVEWMQAGSGVWHNARPLDGQLAKGFQLWLALPPELENAPPLSQYIAPEELQSIGPARVLLGRYGTAQSSIESLTHATYLAVELKAGEVWRFEPPAGQSLAWAAVGAGSIEVASVIAEGEMVVFEESNEGINFRARSDCIFVLGSAVRHPHGLFLGMYSVHTSEEALRVGETGIARIGRQLRAEGRI
ncbi:pirin family protein [Undibacterium sp. Ji83W]|uniref:pirin family protein n=1 Tax=Undibacterium sp. Ji83W TaxID=3413043 RepID=UPI003BF1FEE0